MCRVQDLVRHTRARVPFLSLALLAGMVWLAGCKNADNSTAPAGSATRLNGGGATFDDPIMQKWKDVYKGLKGVEIDYVKSGSGDGIRQMTEKTLQFGCSDAPMNKKEIAAAAEKGGEVVNVPIIMGAVAIVYNVPGVDKLNLSGPVLADIYTKAGKHWDDKDIADLNPGVKLPHKEIVPVRRAESSGTTFIFTDFLSKTSPEFAKTIGANKSPKWPNLGLGQNGNDGIAGFVQKNEGAVGYVELYYAKNLSMAALKNAKGELTMPSAAGVVAAAEGAMQSKPTEEPYSLHEYAYPLTNIAADKAYPICGMSFLVCYKKQTPAYGNALKDFLHWATTDGQKYAEDLGYAPLPKALSEKLQGLIDTIQVSK